ncbi:DUF6530 family protein [uncultured Sphaerochaeta sp.]|uniref:DUF6530 family protein n=1 Tax=uncultured Sphaerochaeta sp. TaxID=886478 RepID=UPI002A0A5DB0|nr:DUF6530 family protein [uncultured Sphaerochaeta sp.]
MKIPTELKHKPIIVSEDYDKVDGKRANESDAKGLSIGLAQWNDRGNVEISAKVWRYTSDKWSRQSEELPLNRVLDLALLICRTSQYFQQAYRMPKYYDPSNPQIDRIGMQGDALNVGVCTENPMIDTDIRLLADYMGQNGELLGERFRLLSKTLQEMGY